MKILWCILAALIVLAVGLSIYLQPNSFALCPYNNGEPATREGCGAAQAIVAVSGGDTSARTERAVALYKKGWAPRLIFSGAAADKEGLSNAAAMRLDAIGQGVPPEAILIEEYSENTSEHAAKTRELLAYYDITDIILVTSGYHQRRASLEFAAITTGEGVTIRNAPTNDRDWGWWWWMTPRGWWLALGEFARIVSLYLSGSV